MTNKTEEVLKYLQNHKSITSWIAISDFGATRLSAIIYQLKKKGYNIITKREEVVDRYGNTCRFARYIYLGKEQKRNCWMVTHTRYMKLNTIEMKDIAPFDGDWKDSLIKVEHKEEE